MMILKMKYQQKSQCMSGLSFQNIFGNTQTSKKTLKTIKISIKKSKTR